MPSDEAARAATIILAYRRGDGPESPYARDLCRRLADAARGGGSAGPLTGSPVSLAIALRQAAARDPVVAAMIRALAGAHGASAPPRDPPSASQNVTVTGSGNQVVVSGGSMYGGAAAPGPTGAEPSPRERFTVLFAAACPDDRVGLRVDRELRALQEAIARSGMRERIGVEPRLAVRPAEFAQALLAVRPRVVHFAGHGSAHGGELYFEDDGGASYPAPAEGLRALFRGMEEPVRCVILNACHSGANADAILGAGVPHVVGMDGPLQDESAIVFSTGFYQALGEGRGIPQAYDWAIGLMTMMRTEGEKPVLYSASR